MKQTTWRSSEEKFMEKAWLIKWDWASEATSVRDRVVNILPAEMTTEQVALYVELLYAQLTSNLDELLAYAETPSRNPYRAEVYTKEQPERTYISCGHNPYLTAQPVQDVQVTIDEETGFETIAWSGVSPNGSQGGGKITRKKRGKISFEPAWDTVSHCPRVFND